MKKANWAEVFLQDKDFLGKRDSLWQSINKAPVKGILQVLQDKRKAREPVYRKEPPVKFTLEPRPRAKSQSVGWSQQDFEDEAIEG
jgi:hypothetical protein